MGRYVPPDQEGVLSGNQIHGKHALGSRAKNISQGILTVRFEMPYPIWCTTCPKPTIIGQGVRFNAQKKKVGNYYSTPIYSFRMKHTPCGGWIEIRTDPKNTAYVVTEGARQRDLGEDKVLEGDQQILTQEEREKLRSDAFAHLEVKIEDKQRQEYGKKRLEELQDLSEQQWEDPYERNRRLRKSFREGRHQREKDARMTEALQDKMSLGLDILPESDADARKAKIIEFGNAQSSRNADKALSKPLFTTGSCIETPEKKTKVSRRRKEEEKTKKKTADLVAEISGNTRAAMDPFLTASGTSPSFRSSKPLLAGIKRKRDPRDDFPSVAGLVDYDSE
jgi:coiled-coil domain-containing protein 130